MYTQIKYNVFKESLSNQYGIFTLLDVKIICVSCRKTAFRAISIDKYNINSYNKFIQLFGFLYQNYKTLEIILGFCNIMVLLYFNNGKELYDLGSAISCKKLWIIS